MKNVTGRTSTQRTHGVSSTHPVARKRASAGGLAAKLRSDTQQTGRSKAAHALLTTSNEAAGQLGAALTSLKAKIDGFHEHGRVRAPNPRAIDTGAMARNLNATLDESLPAMRKAMEPIYEDMAKRVGKQLIDDVIKTVSTATN